MRRRKMAAKSKMKLNFAFWQHTKRCGSLKKLLIISRWHRGCLASWKIATLCNVVTFPAISWGHSKTQWGTTRHYKSQLVTISHNKTSNHEFKSNLIDKELDGLKRAWVRLQAKGFAFFVIVATFQDILYDWFKPIKKDLRQADPNDAVTVALICLAWSGLAWQAELVHWSEYWKSYLTWKPASKQSPPTNTIEGTRKKVAAPVKSNMSSGHSSTVITLTVTSVTTVARSRRQQC